MLTCSDVCSHMQASWKHFLHASPFDGVCDEHPEVPKKKSFSSPSIQQFRMLTYADVCSRMLQVETHLKLLYTAVTRAQRHLNFVETASSKSAWAFFRKLEEQGKLAAD